MTSKRLYWAGGITILGGIAILVVLLLLSRSTPPIELANEFESNAFTLRYPEEWEYQIPQPNIMFLASPDIMEQRAGASATIQRTIAVANTGNTLDDKLAEVLSRGPLQPGSFWEQRGSIDRLRVDTYDAVRARVVGAEQADTTTLQSEFVLLQADSRFVYIFTLTASTATWDENQEVFAAILDSVDILE